MESKKAEKKRLKKLRKKNKRFLGLATSIGIMTSLGQLYFFTRTIINIYIVLAIFLISGIIWFGLNYKKYLFTYKTSGVIAYISAFISSVITLGGVIGCIFLGANYLLANSEVYEQDYEIIERHYVNGSKYNRDAYRPVFTINIAGMDKDLKFTHAYYRDMEEFKYIAIDQSKGFLGYDIIRSKEPKK